MSQYTVKEWVCRVTPEKLAEERAAKNRRV